MLLSESEGARGVGWVPGTTGAGAEGRPSGSGRDGEGARALVCRVRRARIPEQPGGEDGSLVSRVRIDEVLLVVDRDEGRTNIRFPEAARRTAQL